MYAIFVECWCDCYKLNFRSVSLRMEVVYCFYFISWVLFYFWIMFQFFSCPSFVQITEPSLFLETVNAYLGFRLCSKVARSALFYLDLVFYYVLSLYFYSNGFISSIMLEKDQDYSIYSDMFVRKGCELSMFLRNVSISYWNRFKYAFLR